MPFSPRGMIDYEALCNLKMSAVRKHYLNLQTDGSRQTNKYATTQQTPLSCYTDTMQNYDLHEYMQHGAIRYFCSLRVLGL